MRTEDTAAALVIDEPQQHERLDLVAGDFAISQAVSSPACLVPRIYLE
jgi:hypothetical protein